MRKRTYYTLLAVAITAAYVGLFAGLRDWTYATDYDAAFIAPRTVKVYYFSHSHKSNAFLFYFFFPLHSLCGRPYYADVLTNDAFAQYDGWPYYIYDPSVTATQ